jgi:hypothetical protein
LWTAICPTSNIGLSPACCRHFCLSSLCLLKVHLEISSLLFLLSFFSCSFIYICIQSFLSFFPLAPLPYPLEVSANSSQKYLQMKRFYSSWMKNSTVYKYHIFSIHSSVVGHFGFFHNLAIVNSSAINMGVQVPLE